MTDRITQLLSTPDGLVCLTGTGRVWRLTPQQVWVLISSPPGCGFMPPDHTPQPHPILDDQHPAY